MFSSARLKLTAWYLLIIMIISLLFSVAIYYGVGLALDRRFNEIENRLLGKEDKPNSLQSSPKPLLFEDLEAAKRQLLFMLIFANGIILIFSAGAGYFLAGKTLRPIEDMVEEQTRFVADASHELRTPIAAMKVSTEVALRDNELSTDEAREVLKNNIMDLNNLQKLADELLSLAKYHEGGSSLNIQKLNAKTIMENCYKKILPLAEEKRIKLILNINDYYLYADESSLEEMLLIFLDNAVKYTQEGGTVYINNRQDGQYITLDIKDTGIGIGNTDLTNIFNRFYRADKSRSKLKVNGSGLGLAIAKKIIDLHKGQVFVSSQINKGTIFTIKFPIKKI
jgi:two-component system, OmpR family, sensor histidine kinase CiaH